MKAGWDKFRVVEADLAFTSEQKPQVAVLLEMVAGESIGEQVTWYGSFTENARKSTILGLRAIGWKGDDISNLTTVTGEAECLIQIEPGQDGVARPRVRFVGRGGGGLAVKNRMTEDQKKAFAASLKGLILSMSAPNGGGQKADDDIPF